MERLFRFLLFSLSFCCCLYVWPVGFYSGEWMAGWVGGWMDGWLGGWVWSAGAAILFSFFFSPFIYLIDVLVWWLLRVPFF